MEAIKDRGTFEKKCAAAERQAAASERSLASAKEEISKLKAEKQQLVTQLATSQAQLESSPNPAVSELARLERELKETKEINEQLAKKQAIAQKELDYSREAYQKASKGTNDLSQENGKLKTRVATLEIQAAQNLRRIHEINRDKQLQALVKQTQTHRATIAERERELDRARDELRHLRNNRRETRQASVPRSPRTAGTMSPRVGRANGGATSRGTSPAPGLETGGSSSNSSAGPPSAYFNQAGGPNPRFSHLRD